MFAYSLAHCGKTKRRIRIWLLNPFTGKRVDFMGYAFEAIFILPENWQN